MQEEFYSIAFRKKLYNSLDELQKDIDEWIFKYNNERTHSGKYCFGKTPMKTWKESLNLAKEKMLDIQCQKDVTLPLSDEAETGSGGDQPVRNNLSDWNNKRGSFSEPQELLNISRDDAFENAFDQ